MPGSPRFWQVAYNHWSWRERCAVIPIQQAAIRDGVIPRPIECSICGYIDRQTTGRPEIALHLERYSHPLEIYPCCRRCHGKLHGRFRQPERWQCLITGHGNPMDWFHLLSLDPACQRQPFEITYPAGLPPPRTTRSAPLEGRGQLAFPL